jgi:predicted Zn-dependent peptidase
MLAGLTFRVGRADETLARGGITHLIEHLVLHRMELPDQHFNGTTSPLTTTFYVQGDPDEITHFFALVCGGLRDLPIDRMDIERAVLHTEAGSRTRGVTEPLLLWRYGAATYGLPGFAEFGLDELTADDLRSWVSRWFTKGNAVLWICGGPPPADLRLDLPDGPRIAPPAASNALPRTPAYFSTDIDGIAFDAIIPRSTPASAFAAILERRLHRLLRRQLGISYSAHAALDTRDAQHATLTAFADALPAKHGDVTREFINVLIDLATDPVTDDDLAAMLKVARRALFEPAGTAAWLTQSAENILLNVPVRSPQDVWDNLVAVTAEDISEIARQTLATGLAMVPHGQAVGRAGFVAAPTGSAAALDGDTFTPLGRPGARARLIVGADGLSLVGGLDIATVRYSECVAMLAWPDGARLLFAPDAVNVRVEPQLWGLPTHVLAGIDAAIPDDRISHMQPRPPGSIPRPPETVASQAPPSAGTSVPPNAHTHRTRTLKATAYVLGGVVLIGGVVLLAMYPSSGVAPTAAGAFLVLLARTARPVRTLIRQRRSQRR